MRTDHVDPLEVVDRRRHETDCLRNLLGGKPAFLVCGGPSAKPHLSDLNKRGVFSLAVNNSGGNIVRPQAFVCSDPPMKFSHSIWFDPAIMKFVPTPKMTGRRKLLRVKKDGVFNKYDKDVMDCPNIWGFRRESFLFPDDRFFTSKGACWGNLDSGVKKTNEKKTVCTMLIGLRLLRYLGASVIFLVGVDFRMTPDYGYSFDQERDKGASESNNGQFQNVNNWLCLMQEKGVFERGGVSIFNCYERSGLRAFPYVPFDVALDAAIGEVEQEPDLRGWYEKSSCPECKSWNLKYGPPHKCMKCSHEWNK